MTKVERETQAWLDGFTGNLADAPSSPATFPEILRDSWAGATQQMIFQSQPREEALEDLRKGIAEETGLSLEAFVDDQDREHATFYADAYEQAADVARNIYKLDTEQQQRIAPLLDVRKRAEEKGQAIEARVQATGENTYGLFGNALWMLTDFTRSMLTPETAATAWIGGPLAGPILKTLGREAILGAVVSAGIFPFKEKQRAEYGLQPGDFLGETLMGGIATAGLAGTFRSGAAVLRAVSGRGPLIRPREQPPARPPAPAVPAGVAVAAPAAVSARPPVAPEPELPMALPERRQRLPVNADDLDAAANLVERDQVLEAQVAPATPKNVAALPSRLNQAEAAIEAKTPVTVLEEARPPPGDFVAPTSRVDLGRSDTVILASGGRMTVRPMVVELDDLIVSHDLSGRVNPAYPAELQPRAREAGASQAWVAEKAAQLEPELLGASPTVQLGAPVVGPDGVVESGNGRALIIGRAYRRHPERAAAYRAMLAAQGVDVAGFKNPVLVRMRETEIADRVAFAREGNVSVTAGMSASERAFADARLIDDGMMLQWRPGDTGAAANQKFVRAFADRIIAAEELPNFVDADGRLSTEGIRRIEAALVARAWGEKDIVAALYETPDEGSRSILGAMADTAPYAAQVRIAVAAGNIRPEVDPTPAIVAAFRLVERARVTRKRIVDLVEQTDIELGAVPAAVVAAVRDFYRMPAPRKGAVPMKPTEVDLSIARLAGRETIAARLEKAMMVALDTERAIGDIFGFEVDATMALSAGRSIGESVDDLPTAGETLQMMLEREATPDELMGHPEIAAAYGAVAETPTTASLAGYGTPEFFARREYRFPGRAGGPPEIVVGRDAAVARLVEGARAFSRDAPVEPGRLATIVLGPPASGKSTVAEMVAREKRAAIVDADEAKKVIPGYQGGLGANAVHVESNQLAFAADGVWEQLALAGDNMVIPKVGGDADSIRRLTHALRDQGYTVDLVNMKVPADVAFRRMIGRYTRSGRIIDRGYVLGIGDKPSATYYMLKKEGIFSETVELDGRTRDLAVLDGAETELAGIWAGQGLGGGAGRGVGGGLPVAGTQASGGGEAAAAGGIGDTALAADADRVLDETADDLDIVLPVDDSEGLTVTVKAVAARRENEADAAAGDALVNCIGKQPEPIAA